MKLKRSLQQFTTFLVNFTLQIAGREMTSPKENLLLASIQLVGVLVGILVV